MPKQNEITQISNIYEDNHCQTIKWIGEKKHGKVAA